MPRKLPPYSLEINSGETQCFGPPTIEFDLYDLEYGEYYERIVALLKATFVGKKVDDQLIHWMKVWMDHQLTDAVMRGRLVETSTDFWEWVFEIPVAPGGRSVWR